MTEFALSPPPESTRLQVPNGMQIRGLVTPRLKLLTQPGLSTYRAGSHFPGGPSGRWRRGLGHGGWGGVGRGAHSQGNHPLALKVAEA